MSLSWPASLETVMDASSTDLVPAPRAAARCQDVRLSEQLFARLLGTTTAVHAAGLKSFGLLLADPLDPDFPFVATDVAFFDPMKNRRNDPAMRAAFEAQASTSAPTTTPGSSPTPPNCSRSTGGWMRPASRPSRCSTSIAASRRTSRSSTSGCTTPPTRGT